MRYFDIDGCQCRALPFDLSLLGKNKEKLFEQTIFVKLPKDIFHKELEKIFSEFGEIKSAKVSLNPDYSSNGYGYVCFQDKESV
jgi:RNA recognition motif-containing protein